MWVPQLAQERRDRRATGALLEDVKRSYRQGEHKSLLDRARDFVANGQARTQWAAEQDKKIWDTLDYYLGPTGIPDRLRGAVGLLDFTDAGDLKAVAEANRDFVANPSFGGAMNLVNTTGAAALPFATAKMYADGVDVFGDAIDSGTDDLLRYFMDDDGAIRAWHGSPHDFDKFSMDKIGTGEGAQAYGHGLYFAESSDVAKSYRSHNSATAKMSYDGKPISDEIRQSVAWDLDRVGYDKDALLADWERMYKPEFWDTTTGKSMRRELGRMDPAKIKAGNLYEVEIDANPEDFLDWDAPLSEQPEKVKDAFQKALSPPDATMNYWRDNVLNDPDAPMGYPSDRLERVIDEAIQYGGYGPEFGFNVWDELAEGAPTFGPEFRHFLETRGVSIDPTDTGSQALGLVESTFTRDEAARLLKEQGIPGIRYYDQGSRTAGEGTRNYVVFDDNIVRILKKYGILAPTFGALGAQNEPDT